MACAGGVLLAVGRGAGPSWSLWLAWLALGLVAGVVLLPVGTVLVGGSGGEAVRAIVRAPRILRGMRHAPLMVTHYLTIAIAEEMLYRMGLTSAIFGGGLLAILGVSLLFTAVHQVGKREIVIVNVLELFAFSCLLGWLYTLTRSLPLVVAVHAMRDIGIALMGEDSA